jgi:hypothetical protein
MTKLLDEGVRAVRDLPEERQDVAGELLLAIAEQSKADFRLTQDQVEAVKRVQKELKDGTMRLATDDEMAALWKKCGL